MAMLQSTLTTSNPSSLKNNLWSLYELLSFSFLFFVWLKLLILTHCTKTLFQLFLMTHLLQNTFLQIADSLWIPIIFSILMTEFIYYLLVIFAYMFFSIIMITFLLATLVRKKHWNLFTIGISGLASILMYNNSITSLIDLSNNFLFPNDYGIPFLWTLSRNFCHFPSLILFWS